MDSQTLDTLAALEAANEQMEVDDDDEAETQGQAQSETQPVQATETVSHSKRAKSLVWNHFVVVGVEADGKRRSRCIHCNKKLVSESASGTSSMKRHLEICPKKPPSSGDREYDPKVDRDMISEIIIFHDQPFKYVEYEKVRARDKYLNPKCQHISRQTAGADVYKRYEEEREKLKKELAEFKGRVSFTSDIWTASTTMTGYICLTAHYVDESFKLNNKILVFSELKPPHTGEEVANKLISCLKEWGLEKKVFSMTLDNATYNDSMQKILKHRLQMASGNGLLCDGKFFHVRCCAHILNLIVKEGLELAVGLLENIRESVKFVKASGSRIEAFAACVQSVGIRSGAGLSLDVPTRWNSTYDMLARALKFRDAFTSLKECDRSYKSLPSEDEWDRGQKICEFLKPFSTITTFFSGVRYPTANAYFLQVWKIECLLMKYASCDDPVMKEMAKKMRVKFSKYWDEYSLVLAMGAVLDPRLKLQILRTAYDKVDPRNAEKKVEVVKKNLKKLYEEYGAKFQSSSSTSSATPTPYELLTESPLEDDLNYDLFELERSIQPGLDNKKTNLEMYLEDPRLDTRSFTDIEVLGYWKDQGQRYGDLASLACDLLSIPITTVASESAFSVGGRVISPYRNRLLPKNVQALLCTRNWLRGFAEFEGDVEDYFDEDNLDKDPTTTASSSAI
ncbi:hypothetical protein Bca101_070751 [Brassica carinata]